jgi:hypothetical protein
MAGRDMLGHDMHGHDMHGHDGCEVPERLASAQSCKFPNALIMVTNTPRGGIAPLPKFVP